MKSVEMKNIIIGTAGHIDHGKTALVRALTGIDTDRLKEEKQRGISIDLGFAHLDLSENLRLAFVDVPGHERFIKNMLAGVGGIDLVLFVIAADESIKPQTREHFDICRLLGIRNGIIVLTKSDLADPDFIELVRLEADEFVRGSFLEGAPVVAVSSTTGAGLDGIARRDRKACRFGSRKRLLPLFSPAHRSRVLHARLRDRGHGNAGLGNRAPGAGSGSASGRPAQSASAESKCMDRAWPQANAGQRTALNIAGVETSDLRRGMLLAEAGRFQPTRQIDCSFELLPSAKPLKHRAPVHFHAGTAEVEAEVRRLRGTDPLRPGRPRLHPACC